jgi:C-5 cytosine-specific DNA methylase
LLKLKGKKYPGKVGSIVDLVKRYKQGDTTEFTTKIDIVTGGFPCQDFSVSGKRNGFARLLEKWFVVEKLGAKATAVQLKKNYYQNLENYYSNIKKLGADFENLDFSKSLAFLLMTVKGMQSQYHST